jgi:CheY-like chemotaxis protein/HPt (histidine-containing phosphotransfer) domain-containing protein
MMNGRIWVESEPGTGSTFHFTLDFGLQLAKDCLPGGAAPGTGDAPSCQQPARGVEPGPRLDILLVEDNAINRRLAQHVLEKAGHAVVVADGGASALAALERSRFDLVLMDVQMPGMDGIETTLRIREREKVAGGRVPIVALTAHAMPGDRARCVAAGMDGHLVKPIQPATLVEAIKRLYADSGVERRAQPGAGVVLDRAELLNRVEGDAGLLAEIAGTFASACNEALARAREAMQTGNAEGFACEAHTLHGMFRNLAGVAAQEQALRLEALDPSRDGAQIEAILATLERDAQALAIELAALAREASRDGAAKARGHGPKKTPANAGAA